MAAIKALQQWCKMQCDGYRDVAINNMTTSFRDGLAFCALIHKYRPDLINFESLSKDNVYDNNHLAFRVAEDHLGIPALLDAEDMVALRVPDRLSILTYVSQYYNYFHGRSPIGGVCILKRPAEGSREEPSEKKNIPVVAKTYTPKPCSENQPPRTAPPPAAAQPSCALSGLPAPRPKSSESAAEQKTVLVESSNKTGTLNSKCTVCKCHVHLVQRHLVDGKLYHRSCFKGSEYSGAFQAGAYKAGAGSGQPVCPPPRSPPGQRTSAAPVDLPAKAATKSQPAPRAGSVLSAPVRVGPRPVDPTPPPQPWTASAQRTQAARQRFFQTPATAPHTPATTPQGPATAPHAPATAPHTPATTPQGPATAPHAPATATHTPATTPQGPATAPHAPATVPQTPASSSKPQAGSASTATIPTSSSTWKTKEEKDRARAVITKKLTEGNRNNNNIACHSNVRPDTRLPSVEEPHCSRQDRSSSGMSKGKPPSLSLSASSTGTSSTGTSSTSSSHNKESFWLAAISPKDLSVCEASASWRSKLSSAPNGKGPKSPASVEDGASTPEKSKFDFSKNHPASPTSGHTAPTQPATALSPPPPPPPPPTPLPPSFPAAPLLQQSAAVWGPKNGNFMLHTSDTSDWTAVVSGQASAFESSNPKPPSPELPQSEPTGWECNTSSPVERLSTCEASSPKQPRRGSAGQGYQNGSSRLSLSPPVSVSSVPREPASPISHVPPPPSTQPGRSPAESGVPHGDESSSISFVSEMWSPVVKRSHIPMERIAEELQTIEQNLSELEREGVDLERKLRSYEEEGRGDILMDPLMVDWFNLIRKKQSSIRRESELMYIARTQALEEQQPGVEEELRRLMSKPEHVKSVVERKREVELMARLVEIVNDRNAIVEGLEEDRLREEEEDQQLNEMMQNLGLQKAKSKSKRTSSFSKLFRRRSKKAQVEE